MAEQTTFTYELDDAQQNELLAAFAAGNYRPRNTPYSLASVEGEGFNCTLYEKVRHGRRKCCVQGGKARDFVEFVLEPRVLKQATLGYESVLDPDRDRLHAGSDESGKGDYFGPLVVACCAVDEQTAPALREMGVRDCKQMTDKAILAIGAKTRALLGPSRYATVKINPPAYNRLYAKIRNVNRLLAWAHGTCIEELLEKQPSCKRVVVDQFAATEEPIRRALKTRGKAVTVDQHHKAESDVAVAAASVVAREIFLRALIDALPDYGPEAQNPENPAAAIPKGSSDPRIRELAEACVRRNGPNWLLNHCKGHFQTTDKVLAACGLSRADLPPEGQIASAAARAEAKSKKQKGVAGGEMVV